MIEIKDSLPDLPKGWIWTTLGEIQLDKSQNISPNNRPEDNFELYSVPSYETRHPEILLGRKIGSNKQIVEEGTVLLCGINPRINRVWIVGNYSPFTKIASTEWIPFFRGFISPEYLSYFMQKSEFRNFLSLRASGVGGSLMRIKASTFVSYPFPLSPLSEQLRIVSKIEELFTRLDAGMASLKKVKAQLKRYRQAILKHAFEGKLTQKWREKHQGQVESAFLLLGRILGEKRQIWEEQQLARFRTLGRIPKDHKWKSKFKEPAQVDTRNLPESCEGWVWANFEQLAENRPNAIKAGPFGSALKKESYAQKGYKIYGQEQVIRGDPFYGDYYINEEQYRKLKSCAIKPGDILVSLVGTIGKVLVLPEGIEPGIINPRLIKLSLDRRLVNPEYIKTYLMSSEVRSYFSLSSHGGTMGILNLTVLKQLPILLPPPSEQEILVDKIEKYYNFAEEIETNVDDNLIRSRNLRQSILRMAFKGKLVPQDPTDEPAEKLLEQIKQKKSKSEETTEGNIRKREVTKQMELSKYVE